MLTFFICTITRLANSKFAMSRFLKLKKTKSFSRVGGVNLLDQSGDEPLTFILAFLVKACGIYAVIVCHAMSLTISE